MKKHDFSLSWYESFLRETAEKIDIFSFANWKGGNGVLLRHDIDLDLIPALKMGELENTLGISSTYFIQVCSDFYNPQSKNNRERLKNLVSMGHEIGLHFDPTVYAGADDTQLQREAEREADILAMASESAVQAVSLHCPSIHGMFPLFDGFMNAYDPSIFKSDRYISDSCMSFRGKEPHQWVALGRDKTVQLLIHPLHFSDTKRPYTDIFLEKIRNDALDIEQYFRVIECFDKALGHGTLLDSINNKRHS